MCECCSIFIVLCPLTPAVIVVICVSNTVDCVSCRHSHYLLLLLIQWCMRHRPSLAPPCIAILTTKWWCWLSLVNLPELLLIFTIGNCFSDKCYEYLGVLMIMMLIINKLCHSGCAVWGVGLDCSDTRNVGSNLTQSMDVCLCLAVLSSCWLMTGWLLIQGVLPNV